MRPLLNHIHIVIPSSSRSSRRNLLRLILNSLLIRSSSTSIRRTTPVILHLLVELLLRLARPAISRLVPVIATASSSSSISSVSACRRSSALAGDVAIDVLRWWLGDVTAAANRSSTTAAAPALSAFGTLRAQTARIPGPFDTVEKAASRSLHIVEGVAVLLSSSASAAGDECEADGLALGVCAVEFADCGFGVAEAVVGYVGDAFGATGAVVDQGEVEDGADSSE